MEVILRELNTLPGDYGPDQWDAMVPPERVSLKPFFLEAFMGGGLQGIESRFLEARSGQGKLLALSAFSRIRLALDCIAPEPVQRVAAAIRRLWPSFLELELLMAGIPASMADQETLLAPDLTAEEESAARSALVDESLRLLDQEHRAACIWKEFDPLQLQRWSTPLESRDFLFFPSLPVSRQQVTWSDAAGYAASLRSGYRRQLFRSLDLAAKKGLELEMDLEAMPYMGEFHPLYLQVLHRSETRVETLTEEFFRALSRDSRVRYIRATYQGKAVGGALCYLVPGKVLTFLYVGMDYRVLRDLDLYFNLLHATVDSAGRHGVKEIRWGQTSADAKGRMGATLTPLAFGIRFRSRLLHGLVRRTGQWLFPARKSIPRRVFR